MKTALVACALVLAAGPAAAATFNFENAKTGSYTTLAQTDSDLTMTLTRQGGLSFDVAPSGYAPYGTKSLYPFNNIGAGAFVANFSSTISAFTIEMGDYQPSDLDTLIVKLYSGLNGTGTLLDSVTLNCCANGPSSFESHQLTVTGLGGLSVIFNGGSSDFPNSVFYDNISVRPGATAAVPESATWAMFIAGFGLTGAAMRRRKTAVTFA